MLSGSASVVPITKLAGAARSGSAAYPALPARYARLNTSRVYAGVPARYRVLPEILNREPPSPIASTLDSGNNSSRSGVASTGSPESARTTDGAFTTRRNGAPAPGGAASGASGDVRSFASLVFFSKREMRSCNGFVPPAIAIPVTRTSMVRIRSVLNVCCDAAYSSPSVTMSRKYSPTEPATSTPSTLAIDPIRTVLLARP